MKNPKKGTLAHKRFIRAQGAAAFHRGETYDQNLYGSLRPILRQLWSEGYNEARVADLLKERRTL